MNAITVEDWNFDNMPKNYPASKKLVMQDCIQPAGFE
jgi:hypothetical protein